MAHEGYCGVNDLWLSGVRMPVGIQLTPENAISLAADDIDSAIGMLYVTPVTVEENDPAKRYDSLLLKRINALIASGRLITTMATGGEQDRVHDYGRYLLRSGLAILEQIQNGTLKLTSATPIAPTDSSPIRKGPILVTDNQKDSLVDAFYQNFMPGGFAPNRQAVTDDPWPREPALPSWMI